MGFDKEHFESQLKYMKRREFQHERLVDEIKDTTCTLEHRAAACVADDPDDDEPWYQDRYEKFNSSHFVGCANSILETNINNNYCIKEFRIGCANELHRRVVESETVDTPRECIEKAVEEDDRYKAFKAFKEADKPNLSEEYITADWHGPEADKPTPYVPTYDPEFIRESYNELISIAEGQGEYSSPFHFSGPSITQEQARLMLIEYNNCPKPEEPKHPDIQEALKNYPNRWS